jgi:hypothetical protein
MSRAHIRSPVIWLFGILSLAVLATPTMDAAATTNPLDVTSATTNSPVLTGAACSREGRGVLIVTGEQFTPGGEVEVGLFVSGDAHPAMHRSIRASQPIFGANGSTDPALGFQQGGFFGLTLGSWCQEAATVRAYDRHRGTWSNELSAKLGCKLDQ